MIQSGGNCKNCGHPAKEHVMSFSEHTWVSEWCKVKGCNCRDYKDEDK